MCIYRGTELFMTTWWPNSFEAKKGLDWVKGDFEKEVTCSSLEAFDDFLSNFEVESWDYADI